MCLIYVNSQCRRISDPFFNHYERRPCQGPQPASGSFGREQCAGAVDLDTLHRGSCVIFALEASEVRCWRARWRYTKLQHVWTMLGQPDKYDAAKGQELKDFRHRKRGELAQIQRLKANWQLYEREALAAEAGEPGMLVAREIARVPARVRRVSYLERPVAQRPMSDVR